TWAESIFAQTIRFRVAPSYPVARGPLDLTLADFNLDGALDIAVCSGVDSSLSILINQGDGTFSAPMKYPGHQRLEAIARGDLNGDGYPDLAVSYGNAAIGVYLNDGSGAFPSGVDYSRGSGGSCIAVADVDGDGLLDVLAGKSGAVAVFRNLGGGSFAAEVD